MRNSYRERKKCVAVFFLHAWKKEEQAASLCQPRLGPGPTPRCRPRRRRPIYKVAPLTISSTRRAALSPLEASPLIAAHVESGQKKGCEKEQESFTPNSDPVTLGESVLLPENNPVTVNKTPSPHLNQVMEPQLQEVIITCAHL